MTLSQRQIATFAAAVLFFGMTAISPSKADDMKRTVTVSASASVEVDPDAASITSGVVSEAATAREALDANTKSMSNLIDGLKAAGITDKDIQTSNFSIHPRHEHNPKDGGPPKLVGYSVNNSVNVLVRDLPKLGEILDLMVSLGANQMQGMNFIVTNAETLKDDARREAIANAQRRAKLYATAAGAKVGDVVRISEDVSSEEGGPRPMFRAAKMASAVPVAPGQETLEARVTVTWELD
ncbi:SIMPL domain-containing protein [Filomicrobium sp.]|uniref:SIMPL domain-containing protein n=1 Tax=Filomicrobium sp. TaxID=2024831 RepID=UPI002585BB20|nr:SIMPL domain-containing protein [Filomicrobium sp.]MCV0369292.1 SIMPL domain-containing protein [Filomicrobium sp.]